VKKCFLPLAFGTFALGISEFVMMGILPFVAADLHVSIPFAGHFISAYAAGVCVGAPLLLLSARKIPPKKVLAMMIGIYALGNFLAATAPSYPVLLGMRFISGLPHGAFFGVGSIAAEKLAEKGKSARAVAYMISGMTIANLVGVPFGTFISNEFSWRVIFLIVGTWGFVNLVALYRWMPSIPAMPDSGIVGQFSFLGKVNPWLVLATTALGNCGIFCYYSYISPLMTGVSGFSKTDISWIMVLSGLSMVAGNLIGGRISDKLKNASVLLILYSLAALSLLGIFFFAGISSISLFLMCVCTACLFGVSAPNQLLILENSRGAEMMGAAFIQIAFNIGNAVGAYTGGLPIANGDGVRYASIAGAGYLILACAAVFTYLSRTSVKKNLKSKMNPAPSLS